MGGVLSVLPYFNIAAKYTAAATAPLSVLPYFNDISYNSDIFLRPFSSSLFQRWLCPNDGTKLIFQFFLISTKPFPDQKSLTLSFSSSLFQLLAFGKM